RERNRSATMGQVGSQFGGVLGLVADPLSHRGRPELPRAAPRALQRRDVRAVRRGSLAEDRGGWRKDGARLRGRLELGNVQGREPREGIHGKSRGRKREGGSKNA